MASGSTIQTAGSPSSCVSAVAGISMTQAAVDLHAPGHRGTEPHLRRRARQAHLDLEGPGHRVGLRGHLANAPVRLHGRIVGQEDGDQRIGRGRADHLRRHVEHRIAPALAGQLDDPLAGLDHLAGLGADRGHHPFGIRPELGEAHLVLGVLEHRRRRLPRPIGPSAAPAVPDRTRPGRQSHARTGAAGARTRRWPRPAGPPQPPDWPAPLCSAFISFCGSSRATTWSGFT